MPTRWSVEDKKQLAEIIAKLHHHPDFPAGSGTLVSKIFTAPDASWVKIKHQRKELRLLNRGIRMYSLLYYQSMDSTKRHWSDLQTIKQQLADVTRNTPPCLSWWCRLKRAASHMP